MEKASVELDKAAEVRARLMQTGGPGAGIAIFLARVWQRVRGSAWQALGTRTTCKDWAPAAEFGQDV